MRTIEFRGKDFAGIWYHGLPVIGKVQAIIHPILDGVVIAGVSIYVHPETIGQYTGLKDQKGNKIYEGDIIDVLDYMGDVTAGQNRTGLVAWDCKRLAFIIKFIDGEVEMMSDIDCGDFYYSWVRGNIHDNPELLELPPES